MIGPNANEDLVRELHLGDGAREPGSLEDKTQPPSSPRGIGTDPAGRLIEVVERLAVELNPSFARGRRVTLQSLLERDLGIDSLGRVELQLRIERAFDVRLADDAVMGAEALSDLLPAISAAAPGDHAAHRRDITSAKLGRARRVPDDCGTLVEALEFHIAAHPDRPHIRLLGHGEATEELTFRDLWTDAQAVATGLRARELSPGETVALMLPTSLAFFRAFFGILLAGGVPVPLYPPQRRSQIEDHLRRQAGIMANAAARVLIMPAEARMIAHVLHAQVETLRHFTTVEELMAGSTVIARPALDADSIALLQYTSGSTGAPKGVILSHANLLANIRAIGQVFEVKPEDVVVSWLPLYHDMGLIGAWLGSLYHACPLILMSPLAFLARPERWLWAIHRFRGTVSAAPNFAYELCRHRIDDLDVEGLDLSCWRVAGNGAEPVSPHSVDGFCRRFADHGFRRSALMPMYGLAESSVAISIPALGCGPVIDRIERHAFVRRQEALPASVESANALDFVGCGQPIPGHEVRVVDPLGRELGERREGELQFRGPSATLGYLGNPEATAALVQGDWLATGDLGYIAGGQIFPTGRVKDLVIRAGRNIYPQEIEEAVGDIAGIRRGRVAAFASRDARSQTERLIVLAETRTPTAQHPALTDRVRERVTALVDLPPDDVVMAPPGTVLKTSSGKIRRDACRRMYEAGMLGSEGRAFWWQLVRLAGASLIPELHRVVQVAAAVGYAAYFWVVIGALMGFTAVAITLLPRGPSRRLLRTVAASAMWVTGIRLRPVGLEHLIGPGPVVVVVNHSSYLDGLVLSAVLPTGLAFVVKAELSTHIPAGFLLRRLGMTFVERFDPERGVEDVQHLIDLLQAGRSLVFFPEGTFDRQPGLRAFHLGGFIVATRTGTAIVTVTLRGTRSILRAGGWFPRRGVVDITVGPPIAVTGSDWAAAIRSRDRARNAILQACGEPDLAYEPRTLRSPNPSARS